MSIYFKEIKILVVTTKLVYPKIIEKNITKKILLSTLWLRQSPNNFKASEQGLSVQSLSNTLYSSLELDS